MSIQNGMPHFIRFKRKRNKKNQISSTFLRQERSQDFSKGVGAQSYYRGMKAHIDENTLQKTNFKKVGFSTMAFTAKILSWRFRHLNIVGCLLKRRPTKGASWAPQDPPPPSSYAPVVGRN